MYVSRPTDCESGCDIIRPLRLKRMPGLSCMQSPHPLHKYSVTFPSPLGLMVCICFEVKQQRRQKYHN